MRRALSGIVGSGAIALISVAGWSVVVMVIAVCGLALAVLCWIVGDAGRSRRFTRMIDAARWPHRPNDQSPKSSRS